MQFRVLGPLRVFRDGEEVELGRPRERGLLALFLINANQVVSVEGLVDELWAGDPPKQARRSLHVYVSRLRANLRGPDGESGLVTQRPGYVLRVDAGQVDAEEFERLVAEGRKRLRDGDQEGAAEQLSRALDLWRGSPFADLAAEPFLRAEISRLEGLRLEAVEDRVQAQLALGRHREVVEELSQLVGEHPYREPVWGLLAQSLHRSGRQHDARRTLRRARRILMTDLGVRPSPILRRAEAEIFGGSDASVRVPRTTHQLPAPRSELVGRHREVGEISELLTARRLVTLIGPGGSGKSRLALEVAHLLADDFPQGAWWVDLAPLEDPELIPETVARALGVDPAPDRPVLTTLLDRLRDQRLLLVIDNFEHLAAGAEVVAQLLDAAFDVHVLVTSRMPLRLQGEQRYPVAPVTTPPPEVDDPEQLGAFPATRLLLERAREADPSFMVTEDNAPLVVQLVRLLGGLPLAIELAATRLPILSPDALLERIQASGPLTLGGPLDAPDRHRSLRSAFTVSYELLQEDQQAAFARLGVFRGGFDIGAAQANLGAIRDPLGAIGALVDAGLIRPADTDGPNRRFSLLEPVRWYADELLSASGEKPTAARVHAQYFRTLAAEAAPHLTRREARSRMRILETERGNLEAALRWCLAAGEPNLGLDLASSLGLFWHLSGDLEQGRRWLDRLLQLPGASTQLRARGHRIRGDLAYWQGGHDTTIESYLVSANLYGQLDAHEKLAEVVAALALAYRFVGDPDSADRAESEARALLKGIDGPAAVARAKMYLGGCRTLAGDLQEGLDLLREADSTFEHLGEVWMMADARGGMARILIGLGDQDAGWGHALDSLRMFLEMGNTPHTLLIAQLVAQLELTAERPEEAVRLIGAVSRLGDPLPTSFSTMVLGTDLVESIQSALSPEEVEKAWAEGRAHSPEDLLDEVTSALQNQAAGPLFRA